MEADNYPAAINTTYEVPERSSVNVVSIENGYLVQGYRNYRYEQWYCIDLQEVAQKMARFI